MAPAESRIVQDGTASTCPLQQLLWPPATSLQLQYVLFSTPTKQTSTSSSSFKKLRYYVKAVYFWVDFLPPAPTLHTARPIRLQHGPVGAPALRNHTAQPIRLQHRPVGAPALHNHTAQPIRLQHEPVEAPALHNHTARPIRLQHEPVDVGAPALHNHTAQPIRLQHIRIR